MIAEGVAGKDQMLRLRRQNDEHGWNRRINPGARPQSKKQDADELVLSSDSDDEDTRVDSDREEEEAEENRQYEKRRGTRRRNPYATDQRGGLV